jgi:phage/plasmid-associated DNA primase
MHKPPPGPEQSPPPEPNNVPVTFLEWLRPGGPWLLTAIVPCLEWRRIGLRPPKAVTDATESYLESEDVIGEWLNECCVRDANAWESTTALFGSWKGWATGREEWIGSETTFSTKLEDRGEFKRRKNKEQTKRGFIGLRLKGAENKVVGKGEADSAAKIAHLLTPGQQGSGVKG